MEAPPCRLSLPLLCCTHKQDEEATKKYKKDGDSTDGKDDYKSAPAPKPDDGDEEGDEGDGGEDAPDNDGETDGEEGETTYGKVGPQGECKRCRNDTDGSGTWADRSRHRRRCCCLRCCHCAQVLPGLRASQGRTAGMARTGRTVHRGPRDLRAQPERTVGVNSRQLCGWCLLCSVCVC